MEFVDNYFQVTTLNSTGTATQTTSAVFPSAGTYLVTLMGVRASATAVLTIDAASGQTVEELADLSATTAIAKYFKVTTDAAGAITIRNTGAANSTQRNIVIRKLTGLTTVAAKTIGAGGGDASAQTATITAVDSGWWVISDIIYDSSTALAGAILWGGSFASTDENYDTYISSGGRNYGGATKKATSTGDFVINTSITGADGAFVWRIAGIALGPA
jgi:hypothetical protein